MAVPLHAALLPALRASPRAEAVAAKALLKARSASAPAPPPKQASVAVDARGEEEAAPRPRKSRAAAPEVLEAAAKVSSEGKAKPRKAPAEAQPELAPPTLPAALAQSSWETPRLTPHRRMVLPMSKTQSPQDAVAASLLPPLPSEKPARAPRKTPRSAPAGARAAATAAPPAALFSAAAVEVRPARSPSAPLAALEGMEMLALVRECIRRGQDNTGTEGELRARLQRARLL